MIRNRILLKSIAVFLLLETVFNTVAPTISWALTSGPTAPEATSFEPIDTSDIINVATGDFVYNIPLLEVPGPSGGYPVSMSYHGGILPDEESSWAGLGWNINVGAINRTINGFADDYLGAIRTRVDNNTGVERNTFGAGVGLPGVDLGLSVSHDSNLGIGVGGGATIGFSEGGVHLGITAGVNPYNEGAYAGVSAGYSYLQAQVMAGKNGVDGGIGLSTKKATGLGQVSIMTNFNSISFSASNRFESVGATLSSKGIRGTSLLGVPFDQTSSNAGRIRKESFGFFVPIPLGNSGLFLNLRYNYLRYFSYEKTNVNMVGALQANSTAGKDRDNWSFDSYALSDPDTFTGDLKTNDPEKSKGGSFPAYDFYNVNAQGLNGEIQPYIFDNGNLFRQNLKKQGSNDYEIEYKSTNSDFSRRVNFRFKNDFSNTFGYAKNEMRLQNDGQLSFINTPDNLTPEDGYNVEDQHLAGSKHIEWFSITQILDGTAKKLGFIPYSNMKSSTVYETAIRNKPYTVSNDQIGGFMITNESGVTYHYALPAYAHHEYSKSKVTGTSLDIYQESTSNQAYAYTWYLTAITGPDFVDRGGEGGAPNYVLDKDDWGYWVSFDYGCWAPDYAWRNPNTGFRKDLDRNLEFYSTGQKEIYYLNEITTRTHTAFFVKEKRLDGKSAVLPKDDPQSFFPVSRLEKTCDRCPNPVTRYYKPVDVLKLSKIILMSNKDVDDLSLRDYRKNDFASDSRSGIADVVLTTQFDGIIAGINAKSLRTIQLDTDNSLCGNTPNSYEVKFDANGNPITDATQYTLSGKLTLKGLRFLGKGGGSLMPSTTFDYEKNPNYTADAIDIWGFYKSDYVKDPKNENLSRSVTVESANNVDAWSMTSVKTPLGSGIQIQYESDEYSKPAAYKASVLQIDNVTPLETSGSLKITFKNNVGDLRSFIGANSTAQVVGVVQYSFHTDKPKYICDKEPLGLHWGADYKSVKCDPSEVTISSINQSDIIVQSQKLYDYMTKAYGTYAMPVNLPYPKTYSDVPCYNNMGQEINLQVLYDHAPYWNGGNFAFTGAVESGKVFGGGLRVKKIKVSDLKSERTTSYAYTNGTTSYEPFGLDNYTMLFRDPLNGNGEPWQSEIKRIDKSKSEFLKNLYGGFFEKILMISRELPAPGVIYQQVSVEESIQDFGGSDATPIPGKKVYEFEVFDDSMLERIAMYNQENPYAYTCKNDIGKVVPCFGDNDPIHGNPTSCWDQYGNPIACGTSASSSSSPLTLNNFSAWTGALKSVTEYGMDGKLLSKLENHYLHDSKSAQVFKNDLKSQYKNQGAITQIFNEHRIADGVDKMVFSRITEYPLVSLGQTSTNFKTGITTTSQNLAYDFYTGMPSKVLTTDGYGNAYVSETVPAYKVDIYSGMTQSQVTNGVVGMGLKIKNGKNKNMLIQSAQTNMHKVDKKNPLNTSLGLVSASVQTWSDQLPALQQGKLVTDASAQPGIWRKASNFNFVGSDNVSIPVDGLYPVSSATAFTAWNINDPVPDGWQKSSAITLYDVNSHALQVQDINNNFAATRMSLDQTRVIATIANANYKEFAYSGAEDQPSNGLFGSDVYQNGIPNTTTAHTGAISLTASTGVRGFTYYMLSPRQQRTYRVSVWSSQPQAAIKYKFDSGAETAAPVRNKGKAGNWYLLEADIAINTTSPSKLEMWCEAGANTTYFDDFRVRPVNAVMASYVYNQWGEVSHILDNNNLYTEYRYDAMGRLTSTYKESFKESYGDHGIVKTGDVEYNYGTNNPYTLTISTSSTGTRGYIYPSGNVSITQGKDLRFELRDKCQYNTLGSVWIDGKKIDLDKASLTLADGTMVSIQGAGKVITFKNVQTAHTLKADFASNSVAGVVVCNGYTDGNGNTCYDGTYKYAYYDLCGNQGSWMSASRLAEIPSDLKSLATGNCCQYNNGTVSGCSCKPGSVGIE